MNVIFLPLKHTERMQIKELERLSFDAFRAFIENKKTPTQQKIWSAAFTAGAEAMMTLARPAFKKATEEEQKNELR